MVDRNRIPNRETTERETETRTPTQSPSPSSPAAAKTAQVGDESKLDVKMALDWIMEKAITLSQGKVCFGKIVKAEIVAALQELGTVTEDEIIDAIQAKLKLCKDDDPTSYTVFGSKFAADLVASVRSKRSRIEITKKEIEDKRRWEQWQKDFRAIWDDLDTNIEMWCAEHIEQLPDSYERLADGLMEDAEYHRRVLEEKADQEAKATA